jgi:hypothetical protein
LSLLSELNTIIADIGLPVETGIFSGEAPETYTVLVPLVSLFDMHADDLPRVDIQEVRISLFCKNNYVATAEQLTHAVLAADMCVTARTYVDHDDETGYHQWSIDILKQYPFSL